MHIFTLVKSLLRNAGIHIYRTSTLPRNLDVFEDLKKLGFEPKCIFDVGANVGQFAISSIKSFPRANIYSFEPVLETFLSLNKSSKNHPNIKTYQLAFGENPGISIIHLRENSVWNSLTPYNNSAQNSSGKSETITINTIDQFCDDHHISHIDLLKTDTEGFDVKVLSGAKKMLTEQRIGAVYTEITFLKHDHTHTSFFDIFNILSASNFILYGIYESAGDFETMHANALFIHTNKTTGK